MPTSFSRKTSRDVGTSNVAVGSYTVGAGVQTTVIGLSLANKTGNQILANVTLGDNTASNTFLVCSAPVPSGGTLVIGGGDQKIVLTAGDQIFVQSNAATSMDVVMSIMEVS